MFARMKRIPAALVAAALVMTACGTEDDPPNGASVVKEPAAACDPGLDRAFRAWPDAGFSGSIAVSTGGGFDCLAAYG